MLFIICKPSCYCGTVFQIYLISELRSRGCLVTLGRSCSSGTLCVAVDYGFWFQFLRFLEYILRINSNFDFLFFVVASTILNAKSTDRNAKALCELHTCMMYNIPYITHILNIYMYVTYGTVSI